MEDNRYGEYDVLLGDDDDDDDEEEDFVYNLLVNYIYFQYVIQGVTLIQRQVRKYLETKTLNHLIHKQLSLSHKYDIIEYSYAPPDQASPIPLLRNGGFHYREAEQSFNYLKNI